MEVLHESIIIRFEQYGEYYEYCDNLKDGWKEQGHALCRQGLVATFVKSARGE